MPASSRKFLFGLSVILFAGALIGWLYGELVWGLLAAAAVALFWQVRQLLTFTRALHTGDFDEFRVGEGIWQQMFARFNFERERADRSRREYRRLLKEIRKSTDAMPDGAIILDEFNEIVMCNKAAKQLAGFKRKKDRGQRVDNILRDPKLSKLLGSGHFSRDIEIASPVREGGWLNCRIVPYGANQKLLFIRDITERVRLTKMRRDFVANASHELRSPLTVISGYLDSLADDPRLQDSWGQPIGRMQQQAQRMNHIVGELLELSRLENAGLTESTAQLLGRGNEIDSLISNLLSNAVRHTPSDGSISLLWRSDRKGAEIVVTDTGEGIPPEQIPRLTERFFRVDRGRAREDGGVGLGLAIVKHVLNRHDGDLNVTSELGKGSEFRCRFPTARIVVDPPIPLAGGE
jgi:two-component system phosphate regulon sensor histidine kinase PhoR